MAKGKSIVKRKPPPRTVADAFDLLKLKGPELANLDTLSTSQKIDALELYARWVAKEKP